MDYIDPKSPIPIYRQISDGIRRRVAAGLLAPGDQLMSVREMAARLLVNPNTVAKVYRDLEREGLLSTRRGQGTYISDDATALAQSERQRLITQQLQAVAWDVRAFSFSSEEAIAMFRVILNDEGSSR